MARKYNKDIKDYREYVRELRVYNTMKQRCYNKGSNVYNLYGGRGIKICDRWLGPNGFENFYKDMGPRPYEPNGRSYHIDRIDSDKDYSPENCRWITAIENQQNRRDNKYVYLWGDKICISEACRMLKLKRTTVTERMRLKKESPENAIMHVLTLTYGRRVHGF